MTHRVVVLGGTGGIGRRVSGILSARGCDVSPVSRATGVDAYTGVGLDAALVGADVVVDCMNHQTLRASVAVGFFGSVARTVSDAARRAGVGHVVCLSIVNAADPAVAGSMGYYAGKSVQEQVYRASNLPVSIVRTTQWFELAAALLRQLRVGRWALVPRMPSQPVAAHAAARHLAEVAAEASPPGVVADLAGPEVITMSTVASRLAAVTEPRTRVVGVPVPIRVIREGGLLPRGDYVTDATTLDQWLAALASPSDEPRQ